MESDPVSHIQLLLIVVSLLVAAFFNLCEAAYHSISPLRLNIMIEAQMKGAKTVKKLLEKSKDLFTGLAFTKVLAIVNFVILAAEIFIMQYGDKPKVLFLIIFFVGSILLIFVELLPKRIGNSIPKEIANRTGGFLNVWIILLTPLIYILNALGEGVLKLIHLSDKEKPVITEDELKAFIHLSSEDGVLDDERKDMIHNVFDFGSAQAKDIMVPRMGIEALPLDSTWKELHSIVSTGDYSRYPVYDEDLDNVVGLFYVRDIIFISDEEEKFFNLGSYLREPYFSFEQKIIGELFQEMQEMRCPMAIILDEYGGTSGLVTLEDLIEEIVGDIFDEYDSERPTITSYKENEYVVNADMKLDEVNEETGLSLESDTFETIGGYIMEKLGRIPNKGDIIFGRYTTFTVLEVDKNKVERVRIQVVPLVEEKKESKEIENGTNENQ